MLSPEYYDQCADVILEQYAALEDAIISSMIQKLLKHGFMTSSAKHQAEMLQEAGLLYTDIFQLIANQTDATANHVKTLFEDSGVEVVEFDNKTHKKAGLSPVDIRQSDSMRQTIEAGCRKTYGQMWNLTKTLAITTQKEYINACNNAYMKISSVDFSYNDAITNAVKNAAVGGLDVKYPSGNVAKLEVAIRRAVLTGVRQTCTEISRENAVECGCYLMEITAHSGSRPEHEKWQGQLATLTGRNAGKIIDGMKVYTLHEIGYGEVDGFCGANCHHDWDPYYEGISTPNYTKEELDEMNAANIEYKGKMYTEYQISQMQRYRERHIRELKRQTAKAQDIVDFTDNPELKATAQANYQATAARLKRAEQGLKDFCKATGRDREKSREQVLGFSHSEAQRAVHAAKNYANNKLTFETKGGIIRPYEIKLPREDRKRIIARGISEEKPIFAVDTEINKFASYVKNIPKKKDFYDVALHGAPTSAEFFGERIDAYTLANIIRNRKDYVKGGKIRLLSCSTGNTESTGNCMAQILANELGVEVEAPTQTLWVNEDGSFFVSSNKFSIDGYMKIFYPRE